MRGVVVGMMALWARPRQQQPDLDWRWRARPLSSIMRAVDTSNNSGPVLQEQTFRQVTLGDLVTIRHFIRQAAASCGLVSTDLEELVVAVDEAATNIVCHGFQGRPADIAVAVACGPDAVEVTLVDQGPAFDPQEPPPPDTSLPLEARPSGGMGVHLMREFCDELDYRREPGGGNELRLLKKKGQPD